jgi:hypothetical protein
VSQRGKCHKQESQRYGVPTSCRLCFVWHDLAGRAECRRLQRASSTCMVSTSSTLWTGSVNAHPDVSLETSSVRDANFSMTIVWKSLGVAPRLPHLAQISPRCDHVATVANTPMS